MARPSGDGDFDTIRANTEEILDLVTGVIAAQNRMIEAMAAQGEMMAELLGAAKPDTEPSHLSLTIAELAGSIKNNTDVVQRLSRDIRDLPEQIADAFGGAAGPSSPSDSPRC
jgi:hypothetical protein